MQPSSSNSSSNLHRPNPTGHQTCQCNECFPASHTQPKIQSTAQTSEQATDSFGTTAQQKLAPSSSDPQAGAQRRVSQSLPSPQQGSLTSETTQRTVGQPASAQDKRTMPMPLPKVQTALNSTDTSAAPFVPFSATNGSNARGDETHAATTALGTSHSGPQGLGAGFVGESDTAATPIMMIDCQLCDERHEFGLLCATMEDILLPQRWRESQQAREKPEPAANCDMLQGNLQDGA